MYISHMHKIKTRRYGNRLLYPQKYTTFLLNGSVEIETLSYHPRRLPRLLVRARQIRGNLTRYYAPQVFHKVNGSRQAAFSNINTIINEGNKATARLVKEVAE